MKQPFKTEDLKMELERSLGFPIQTLQRLDGASALNFRAVREGDGLTFLVKCSPLVRQKMYEHLVRHLEEMKGTKAVGRLFENECPRMFQGFNLICLSWCDGIRMFPDELSEEQLRIFLQEYQLFSAALQKTTLIVPHDPLSQWRQSAWHACGGFRARPLRWLMARYLPSDELVYREDRIAVIHGDFHHGNFLFSGGRLSGIFDLEEFCGGYPADDIVRYFICAGEHLRWYQRYRMHRLLDRFAIAVECLPYPENEWLTAIDGLLVRKIYGKVNDRHPGFAQTINLLFRARFYLSLKRIARSRWKCKSNRA